MTGGRDSDGFALFLFASSRLRVLLRLVEGLAVVTGDDGQSTKNHDDPTCSAATPSPGEQFRELSRDFVALCGRLRFRAMAAKANGQGITMGLHVEAADAIEELCAALSEERQLRWRLRGRLDAALSKEAESNG